MGLGPHGTQRDAPWDAHPEGVPLGRPPGGGSPPGTPTRRGFPPLGRPPGGGSPPGRPPGGGSPPWDAHPEGVPPRDAHPEGVPPLGRPPGGGSPPGRPPGGGSPLGRPPGGGAPRDAHPEGVPPRDAHPEGVPPWDAHLGGVPPGTPTRRGFECLWKVPLPGGDRLLWVDQYFRTVLYGFPGFRGTPGGGSRVPPEGSPGPPGSVLRRFRGLLWESVISRLILIVSWNL